MTPWTVLRAYLPELVVALLLGVVFFLNASFFDIDTFAELYHLESAKEMLQHGMFAVPVFNHHEYLIRPPLWTWTILPFFKTLGVSVWNARIPALILSMMSLGFTYLIGSFLFQSRVIAIFSVVVLGTMWGYFSQSQLSTGDILWTVLLLGFIWTFLEWHPLSLRRHAVKYGEQGFAIAFGVLMGLMLLAKGMQSVVTMLAIIIFYLTFTKSWRSLRAVKWAPMLLSLLIVTAPWLIWVSVKTADPLFAWNYLIEQPFQRLMGEGPWRILNHNFLFYLTRLPGLVFPYTLILAMFFFDTAMLRKMTGTEHGWLKWLFSWFLVGLVFNSLSAFQEPSALLPFYPALALMLGYYMGRMVEMRDGTPVYTNVVGLHTVGIMGAAVLVTLFILYVMPDTYVGNYWRFPGEALLTEIDLGIRIPLPAPFPVWKLWLLPAPFILITGGLIMYLLMAMRRPQMTGVTLCATAFACLLFVKAIYLPISYRPIAAHFATVLNEQVQPEDKVLLYSRHPDVKRMLFYLNPEVSQRVHYVTRAEDVTKAIARRPQGTNVYGVMRERSYYNMDYDTRQDLRINEHDWKWDNRKLSELWKFFRIQQPIFENMKFDLLLFQTVPPMETSFEELLKQEPPKELKKKSTRRRRR